MAEIRTPSPECSTNLKKAKDIDSIKRHTSNGIVSSEEHQFSAGVRKPVDENDRLAEGDANFHRLG